MKADQRAIVSRRALLGGLAVAVSASGAVARPASAGARLGPGQRRRSLRSLATAGYEEWSSQVGTDFQVRGETGITTLKLVAVRPLESAGRRGRRDLRSRAFAAVFEAPAGSLPAGNRRYPLSHPEHGRLDIFFGPAGERLTAVLG
jgi:hypothetical protein